MISNVTLKDKDNFNRLGLLVNSNFINVYHLDSILNSDVDYVYGYYINDELVGFIHVSKLYEVLDIVNIVVDVPYRNKGFATMLLEYTINCYDDIDSVMLEVNEHNDVAIDFYDKNNFKVINVRKKYYGNDDALIMKRDV